MVNDFFDLAGIFLAEFKAEGQKVSLASAESSGSWFTYFGVDQDFECWRETWIKTLSH